MKETYELKLLTTPTRKIYHFSEIILVFTVLLLIFVIYVLIQSSCFQAIKSVLAGVILVYYSMELMYFESLDPGIQSPSPLSSPVSKFVNGHGLHLQYALAAIFGLFLSLFVNMFA